MIAFGPVPSRRLGRSLGINNIPPKVCSYSCVYCQIGRTSQMEALRRPFYRVEDIAEEVEKKVDASREMGQAIDYLAFVPDGEPTLDVNLGREIETLKPLSIRVAVISNASLLWRQDVKEDLCMADWVSLKVDAAMERVWRRVNRPHRSLRLNAILDGILDFSEIYEGDLVTETMLVSGVNDDLQSLEDLADFLAQLKPSKAYISVPIRPPAEDWVQPPSEERINKAYQIFKSKLDRVELLVGYEGDLFGLSGDTEGDLLAITAVHPMREEALRKLLEEAGKNWNVVEKLVEEGQLVETAYGGRKFYLRWAENIIS